MTQNKSLFTRTRKKLIITAWIAGLLLIGLSGYFMRTKVQPAKQTMEPTLVIFLPSTSEVVGIAEGQECYRRKLGCAVVSYGVGANKLVVVGEGSIEGKMHPVVVLVDLLTGLPLAQKPLGIRMNPMMEGLVQTILVSPQQERVYIAGPSAENNHKYMLATFDTGRYEVNHEPIEFPSQRVIAVDNDLGFCSRNTLYRYSKPPLTQLNGFDAPKEFELKGPLFYYVNQIGLFNVNRAEGTISRLTDKSLEPVAKPVRHPLAGTRLSSGMVIFDHDKKEVTSINWNQSSECTIQSFDLTQETITWQRKFPGSVGQILYGASGKLYLVDSRGTEIRALESRQSDVTNYTQLGKGYSNDIVLLWGK